MEMPQRISK